MSSDNLTEKTFIINDDTFTDDKKVIKTDLYTAIIYLNRFNKTELNGGYVKISYFMPSGTMRPNATYTENVDTKKYKCKNLYIFKASHKITMDSSFDGELVIEMVPTVNTSDKLFLCLPLINTRYSTQPQNDIDKLLNISVKPPTSYTTMDFTLQNLIEPKQKKIIYKSGIDTVVVFTTPIPIQEIDFTKYNNIPDDLFAIYPVNDNYKIIPATVVEGFSEGVEGVADNSTQVSADVNNLFAKNLISCTLVDDNDNAVNENVATYLVDGANKSQNSANALIYAFIIMITTIIISYFGSPLLFHYSVAKHITDSNKLTHATVVLSFMLFLLGIILLISGNTYDVSEMWVGVFIIIFLGLSALSIALQRNINPYVVPQTNMETDMKKYINNIHTSIYAFFDFLYSSYDDIFVTFFALFIALFIILIISAEVSATSTSALEKEKKTPGYISHLRGMVYGIGFVYGTFCILWILALFKSG